MKNEMGAKKYHYPYYHVLGRRFDKFEDAKDFAQDHANSLNETVHIMTKLDSYTSFYVEKTYKPKII
jgi:hypothetical protein